MESFKEKGQLLVLGHYMHAIFQRERATISIIGIGKDKSILDGKNKVEQFVINKCFFFIFLMIKFGLLVACVAVCFSSRRRTNYVFLIRPDNLCLSCLYMHME